MGTNVFLIYIRGGQLAARGSIQEKFLNLKIFEMCVR